MKPPSQNKLMYIKCGLFLIILFFWVTGVALICIGASVQMKLSDVSVVIVETSSGAPTVLTIVGVFIFFLSLFGAVAAVKENSIMMKSFAVLMLLVFAIEIIVGASAFSYRDRLQLEVLHRFLIMLKKYGSDKQITRGVDGVQQQFRCCGARNFTDWFYTNSTVYSDGVPGSCCKTPQPKCGENATSHSDRIFKEGCVLKIQVWLSEHIDVIGAVGVGLGFTQILGVILSCLIVKILQENYVAM
ncbi:CD63 antigen-like [Hyperolius riggenbachi]|uniref:CD63 antigen-like n=1 Tax=Hyperolius riggenbachi TaxID=752182 RepID=UPI0035A376FF